jgi:uncharacterized metal-binding protein YceD (DUF177 family)
MPQKAPNATAFRVAALPQNAAMPFALRPEAAELARIAADLGLLGLRKLSFTGDIRAEGDADWRLQAKLGATVVQACVVTLEPVTTRIDMPVTRAYRRDYVESEAPEAEMPEDDTVEPLGLWIDPTEVMQEMLALALPLYPRSEGSELGKTLHAEPGVTPMRDEDAKPFAGLAGLRDRLQPKGDPDDAG